MRTLFIRTVAVAAVVLASAASAPAAKVVDITRLAGQRTNVLTGVGLVYGLKGTGDGGDFLPAIKPLAAMLARFGNPTLVPDLKNAQNVAIVSLIAVVPSVGVRNGDHVEVRVMSMGAAGSLKGGHLFVSPMKGPMPDAPDRPMPPLALSSGDLQVDDPSVPTVATIKGGCVMETDLIPKPVENGQFSLVIDEAIASWQVASTIAKMINESEGDGTAMLATAIDAKNVIVNVPPAERARPDSFVARVQQIALPPLLTEARVILNEKTGAVILTGDVEIDPTVVSYRGLTLNIVEPKPVPTPRTPVTTRKDVATVDPAQQGGAKLRDLAMAFEQLKVPAEDRVAIIKDLHRSGRLHAKLIVNGTER